MAQSAVSEKEVKSSAAVAQNTIRVERSATLAVAAGNGGNNYEKLGLELHLALPSEPISADLVNTFISTAEDLLESHIEEFKKKQLTSAPKQSSPLQPAAADSAKPWK